MVAHKADSDRLVQHGFFEPLGLKWKDCEEKSHLFYGVIITQFLSGLLTDYMLLGSCAKVEDTSIKEIFVFVSDFGKYIFMLVCISRLPDFSS